MAAPTRVVCQLPLFKDLPDPMPLQLLDATTYPDGTAIHVYQRPRSA
jgi:hypothetical protein